ncbi:GAF and ANTAR domain-containing protein [Mycolicibacterium sp. ELW1]|uniref:GAF and ANTAR domain-containing protein n=1 Tax=Mycobacteriaceae TaxID=1762 RepID=UPI0011EEF5A5|nr:GAF and ANTAR domain-containing protein [Mycobacterium sp. ELW1]QEN12581.1 GAF and ANTAR domain-containing protein [Mycobacterium sp. ELW1]
MPADASNELARTLGNFAMRLQAQKSRADTLQTIVDAATAIVPGARWVGISLIQRGTVVAEAPTDPIVAHLDQLQSELGDGPCITALREHHTVLIDDMSSETRWPEFVRQAISLDVHSLLSFQLFVESETLGAMNLYGAQPNAFTQESVDVGTIVAQHAAVAMFGTAAATQFHAALASRDVISQAKGILMHRHNITGVEAFAMLTHASADTNIKLVDVARWLVAEHESAID